MTNSIKPLISIVLITAIAGCGGGNKPPAGSSPSAAMPPTEVTVITVARGKATITKDLPGRLEAYRIAQVRARVEGIVEKRLFTEGSDVKEGATLFQIEPHSYRAAYASAQSDVEVARQTVERYKPLLEIKAVSQQDYDLATAKLKESEAILAKAQLDLDNTRVPAPISGRIGRELVTEGALVGHGEATNLALIEQIDPIYTNFTRPSSDLLKLQKAVTAGRLKNSNATKVELVLEDGSIYPEMGTLLFSDLAVDPSTGSISIRATFPNHKHQLLPGMFAMIRFPEANADDAIRIPQKTVMTSPQGQFVMVVDAEGKVSSRPIKTDAMAEGDFIVSDGLQVGDKVIVDGLQKVRPGSVVKAVPLESLADAPALANKKN